MDKETASWTHLQSMIITSIQLLQESSKEIYHLMSELGDDPFTVGCYSKIIAFLNEIDRMLFVSE